MSEPPTKSRPGDVIFVYSGGKDGYFNVWLQKQKFDFNRDQGPWFSHVAIAINDEIALETSTAPHEDDPPTWSGSVLTGGVRVIALLDLFAGSRYWSVLRSSHAGEIPKETFAISQPYISGLYGSKYSIQAFEDYLRSIDPLLTFVSGLTGLSEGWTSDATDAAHQIGHEFRQRVLKDFPDHKFVLTEGTYYCSDLVRVILSKVNLIPEQDRLTRITPSALFDLLLGYGFVDVTNNDFSRQTVEAVLARSHPRAVKEHHDSAVTEARFWNSRHGFDDLWDVVEKQHSKMISYLDEAQKKLSRIMGIPPIGGKT